MNGTFNAYLLQQRPKLRRWRHRVTMNRNMMLQDDIKEYWGFYLLKGSIVKLSVCSRHEGASFIVVKGLKDARKCSWIGELDSTEGSDEISSEEFEFAHHILEDGPEHAGNGTNAEHDHGHDYNEFNFTNFQTLDMSQRRSLILAYMKAYKVRSKIQMIRVTR